MLPSRSRYTRLLKYVVLAFTVWAATYSLTMTNNKVPSDTSTCLAPGPQLITTTPKLTRHPIDPNGLLSVSAESSSHPIFQLISDAERQWERKLRSASSSYGEAVKEYRRRYGRGVPRGFDQWWNYVQKHDIQLPDDYDSIHHDIEPFWGLDPKELNASLEPSPRADTYIIGKLKPDDPIRVLSTSFRQGKTPQETKNIYNDLSRHSVKIVDHLRDVEQWLPPFRAVLTPHDGPGKLTDWAVKSAVMEAVWDGRTLKKSELPKRANLGWKSACSPTSPARFPNFTLNSPSNSKTFIHNHPQTMDPCAHPNLLLLHGQFLSHNDGPGPQKSLVPEFSSCSTQVHHNIRLPTPYGWLDDLPPQDNPKWEQRLNERLLWRGLNTGIFHAKHIKWQESHRIRTVRDANALNGTLTILPPVHSPSDLMGSHKVVKKAHLNPALLDIAFADKPISCAQAECDKLRKDYTWRERQDNQEAGKYKYVLDVDGNGWSGRFKRLVTSHALPFKSTIYPEWFAERIAPWVHYVPVQVDLSDLHDALIFFRGDGNGDGAHEELAKKIASQGREWSKKFWRREDLVAYFFRLMLEYARVMSEDREAMTMPFDETME